MSFVPTGGTPSGGGGGSTRTEREEILAASDVVAEVTYLDAGTKGERITRVDYSSATVHPGDTARKDITYTLVSGTKYIVDEITWSIV